VVPEGRIIPARHLALGVPARVMRELADEEVERSYAATVHYAARAQAFLAASKEGK